jgi:NAD-dependent dihydropyrimidine dehydrogenase PreA subunit
MRNESHILVCRCAERGLVDVAEGLDLADAVVVDDLCDAAAKGDPILKQQFAEIHACHPRAVKALFAFAGHPLSEDVELHNHRKPVPQQPNAPTLHHSSDEVAWYPVIDYSRCTNCKQCHQFCLFGVYEQDEDGKVTVANPRSCKNNCPACARICPETAIIFPKVGESPIDGAEVTDETERKANVKVNVDEILGDDVYAALNARKAKRKSLLNKKKIEQALEERKRCSGDKDG